jgi:hypothetical protein
MRIEEVRGQLGAELISDLARDLHYGGVHEQAVAAAAIARRETPERYHNLRNKFPIDLDDTVATLTPRTRSR